MTVYGILWKKNSLYGVPIVSGLAQLLADKYADASFNIKKSSVSESRKRN